MAHVVRKRHVKRSKSTQRAPQTPLVEKSEIWRVLAPFVAVSKKVQKQDEDKQFSFYLKKKPLVLLHDLSLFMSDSVDLPSLFNETSDVLRKVTKATGATLYLVDRAANEIFPSRFPIDNDRHRVKWQIQDGTVISAFAANRKEYVLAEDILCDSRFPLGLGYEGSSPAKSVLCIPVVAPDGDCFAVIELYRDLNRSAFTQDDLKICVMVTAWMGVALHQNQERLALKRQAELNDYLLELVKCYFEDHVLMEKLMSEVVQFAKVTLGAERGSFFIIDQESDEMIAHLFEEDAGENVTKKMKVRFSKERGIAGLVARTGVTVNIRDAYKDSRFNKEIDQRTGFITRSILCMPILGSSGTLGVVQVVNKRNGGCFTNNDESLFKTFSLYCSMALHYTNIHTQINKQTHFHNINLQMVNLQQKPCIHDITRFDGKPQVTIPSEFNSFAWYISPDELDIAPMYVNYMFLQLINPSEIEPSNLMHFILTVRKFYRNKNPYHNFEHAFTVCHCMYVIIRRNWEKFSSIEIKALLVACLCHDLDHGGFTNNFLVLIKHDIAELYQSSVLENHHCYVTLQILKQYAIFPKMNEVAYNTFLKQIQYYIIATDLCLYFERRVHLIKAYREKSFRWYNEEDRNIAKSIMMNSCDLAGQCKPFLTAIRITENVYREFYHQGDLEKQMKLCPLSIMDREKEEYIPEDQIRFLSVIVIPCTELLCVVLTNTIDLYNGALRLRETWRDIVETKGKKVWRQDDSIVLNK